jgi:hypothetical protein
MISAVFGLPTAGCWFTSTHTAPGAQPAARHPQAGQARRSLPGNKEGTALIAGYRTKVEIVTDVTLSAWQGP